jgi:acetyltransferase-like isoleucine patch superfamily enzyme
MKNLLKIFYSFILVTIFKLLNSNFNAYKSIVFFSKFRLKKTNKIDLYRAVVEKSSITIDGKNNQIFFKGNLSASKINIWGSSNQIIIHPNVKLNKSTLIIRGNNINLVIGKGSTFGSMYLVCMGENNYIKIGENCMFAENINLWASDSHPIYNIENQLINHSKPITIGNDVWVGSNCTILKGVNIGNNSILGMSSFVTKNIEPATLNVGSPSRCIKSNVRWVREFIQS